MSTLPIHPQHRHPLTGEPIRALWVRPDGRVMWPILGASGAELRAEGDYVQRLAQVALSPRVLSIYSTHDNIVYPPSSSMLAARGARDLAIDGGGHLALLFHPRVIDQIATFLLEPEPAALTS